MLHNKIMPREMIEEAIAYLVATYPKTFFQLSHQKRPLKKNIISDLEKDGVLDDDKRTAAVSFYMRDWNYEDCLQAGAKRVDLDGKEVGTVTEQEAIEAQTRLRTQKAERRQILNPISVVRSLHANGKIPTDQLSKITAPAAMERISMVKATKPNGADLTKLRALWGNIESVLSIDDETLRTALVAPALKVLIVEASKVVATLEVN